jgi:hypothetical protein
VCDVCDGGGGHRGNVTSPNRGNHMTTHTVGGENIARQR